MASKIFTNSQLNQVMVQQTKSAASGVFAQQINPNLFAQQPNFGGISTILPFFPPITVAPTPTPAAPQTPTGPSQNLQALLASIPVALDGQVITTDHHNTLRAVVIALANQLGVGFQGAVNSFTVAPAFLQTVAATPNWVTTSTFSAGRPGAAGALTNPDGWLPVEMPDGMKIQSMTVFGRRTGATAPTSFQVVLNRQGHDTGTTPPPVSPLITLALESQSGPFKVSGSVTAATAATASLNNINLQLAEDLKLVNTTDYKYFVRASVTAAADVVVEIDAIQFTLSV